MQTIQIEVQDSYLEKFLNLLQALPQDEIKIIDHQFQQDKKMLEEVVRKYRSGEAEFTELTQEFWDEMDEYIDSKNV
jgi:hypothetical protein